MQTNYLEIPCIYFSSSAEGILVDVNVHVCGLLGYTREELVNRKMENLFSLATRIFQQTHFFPLLQLKGHAEELYITLRPKTGDDIPVLVNAVRVVNDGQNLFLFAGIELDKRQKFEEEIIAAKKTAEKALNENSALKAAQAELQKRAEELDKQIFVVNSQNKELKQLNHLATHTLREPLRKILFFSSQLQGIEDGHAGKIAAEKINKTAADMYAKLEGLQRYVWLTIEDLTFEKTDLSSIITNALKQVELDHPDIGIKLQSDNIPSVDADRQQLHILIKEILSNAVQFRKPGNLVHIRIGASIVSLNKFRQLSGKYRYAEFLKLEFTDSGIGFDDAYQDQAFDLFRTLHPTGRQGIGLSLCKKIVENHSGWIELKSQKDLGATASIFLPVEQ